MQEYRDFAENRGKYVVGATNIPVYRKDGSFDGYVGDVPMPDFGMVNEKGFTTFISPAFVVSAAHNKGNSLTVIGNKAKFAPVYASVGNYVSEIRDFHVQRVKKVIVESAPAPFISSEEFLTNQDRYITFARVGAGYHYAENPITGVLDYIRGVYAYNAGGIISSQAIHDFTRNRMWWSTFLPSDPRSATLAIGTRPGDSGSPMFVWDTLEKRWVLFGVHTHGTLSDIPYKRTYVATLIDNEAVQSALDALKTPDVENIGNSVIQWRSDMILQDDKQWLWYGLDNSLAETIPDKASNDQLNATKDLRFNGDGGIIELAQSVNLGAGLLRFSNDYTLRAAGDGNFSWVGGGVEVDKDKTVLWQVNGLQDDALHKIGAGTVILDQQADAQGRKQAFSTVTLFSGRPTVVLNSADQLSTDNIRFGYRGGTLDVNGHDLTFDDILHNDSGARIVNRSQTLAHLDLTGDNRLFLGELGETDSRDNLNVTTHQRWQLAGGAQLNQLAVADGVLTLSGEQVEHAGKVFFANDWQDKTYHINQLQVAQDAALTVAEHAHVTGDITLADEATLNVLGRSTLAGDINLSGTASSLSAVRQHAGRAGFHHQR
ncbi:hypothetical protein E05_45970 [Plautia stali symbiont]|nr:hypothetical protein E05_45970 [Plautia stali symbiont]